MRKAVDTTKLDTISRNVYGHNLINELTIENLKVIIPILKKFIGKKIKLADGCPSKLLRNSLKYYSFKHRKIDGASFRTHIDFNHNHICLWQDVTVKTENYEGGGYCVNYYKQHIFIGAIDSSGLLITLSSVKDLIQSYSLNEYADVNDVKKHLKTIESMESQLRDLQYKYLKYRGY